MSVGAEYQMIIEKLHFLISKRFGICMSDAENSCMPLLGSVLGLNARDLLYIYFDIEREFNVQMSVKDVANGGLSSVDNIARLILAKEKPE